MDFSKTIYRLDSFNLQYFAINGTLADKVANSDPELQKTIFGEGFGVPTDLEIGPDGMLYISSLRDGAVYRISR
ncbi:MAG: hypothetical protein GEU26_16255 [Nitrososphaeraceae archaeon]|nr:hypothetical protein [Nitrososphaeraceae archaeon]